MQRIVWVLFLSVFFGCGGGSSQSGAVEQGAFALTAPAADVAFTYDRFLIVDAVVNGVPGRFILDTGAQLFGVTEAFANRAGLVPTGVANVTTVVGTTQAEVRRIGVLQFGNVVGRDIDAVILDLPGVDGAIGEPLLKNVILRIDYEAEVLTLVDAQQFNAGFFPDIGEFQSVSMSNYVIQEFIRVNGVSAGPVLIDTGSAGGLLSTEARLAGGLTELRDVGITSFTAINGTLPATAYIVVGFQVGPFELEDQFVVTQEMDLSAGLLGNLVLQQFTVILDPVREQAYFRLDTPVRFELL